MSNIVSRAIDSMSIENIQMAREAEEYVKTFEQIDVPLYHSIHDGIYTRTAMLYKGETMVGAHIIVPTTLIVSGHLIVCIGDENIVVEGVRTIIAERNRKQVLTAIKDTCITMCFRTNAKTVKEAEDEFTSEPHNLASRLDSATNIIIGE